MSSVPLYGPPKVGGDILSYCSRCKMELAHVVVAMVGSSPVKVLCKTCKSQHRYRRADGGGPRASGRVATAAKPRLPARAGARWEQKLAETHSKETQPYSAANKFSQGDVISHPNFGVGIVEEVKLNGKIVVIFREGEKILIHGRT